MNTVFSPGEISPYQIIMASETPGGVWCKEYYQAQIALVQDLLAQGLVPGTGIRGVSYIGNITISFVTAEVLIYLPWLAPIKDLSEVYTYAAYHLDLIYHSCARMTLICAQ